MRDFFRVYLKQPGIPLGGAFLIIFSVVILSSIAPFAFPVYFLFLGIGIIVFLIFSHMDFEVLFAFSWVLYIGSIAFLALPLLIGQVTRGTVRWVPIGALSVQPAEIVKPFLIVFFAYYLTNEAVDLKRVIKAVLLFLIPEALILMQPSLGVAVLTFLAFVGVALALQFDKRYLVAGVLAMILVSPLFWQFMAPYQRGRVLTFFNSENDPTGAGYNSIQSTISVGSGGVLGRGLGEGVQTQLAFLPERHTDFIFASVAEELGFVGAVVLLIALFVVLLEIARGIDYSKDYATRAVVSGIFLTMFAQAMVHIGMNMGILPITGLPLPLVSAGGSSLLASMIMLGMVVSARAKV